MRQNNGLKSNPRLSTSSRTLEGGAQRVLFGATADAKGSGRRVVSMAPGVRVRPSARLLARCVAPHSQCRRAPLPSSLLPLSRSLLAFSATFRLLSVSTFPRKNHVVMILTPPRTLRDIFIHVVKTSIVHVLILIILLYRRLDVDLS